MQNNNNNNNNNNNININNYPSLLSPLDEDHETFRKECPDLTRMFETSIFLDENSECTKLEKVRTLTNFLNQYKWEIVKPGILFEVIKYDYLKSGTNTDLYLTSFKTLTNFFGYAYFKTKSGKTLLMQACKYQKLSYIRHVVTMNPDLYAETKDGLTFLDYLPKLNGRMDILNIIFQPNDAVFILDFWSSESMCPIFSDFENPNSGIVKGFDEDVRLGVLYISFKSYDLACMIRNYFNKDEKEFMKQFGLSHSFVTVLNNTKASDKDNCFFDGFGKVEIVSFIKRSIGNKFGED